MSILAKIKGWIEVLAAPADDPRQALSYALQRHRQLMEKIANARHKLVASKQELELKLSAARARAEMSKEEGPVDHLAEQLSQMVMVETKALEAAVKELEQEEQELAMVEQRLTLQEQAFRARQESLEARFSAAETWARIHEDLGGVSKELAELGATVEKAEQHSEEVREKTMTAEHLIDMGSIAGAQTFSSPVARDLAKRYSVEAASENSPRLKQVLGFGFKSLMELEYEFRQLKDVLGRRRETDPLSLTYVRPLAEETYRRGLSVLSDGLSLLQAIRTPGEAQLERQILELEDEINELGREVTETAAESIIFRKEALVSARGRLALVERQHLRASDLLHQCTQCISALNRTRIEMAALKVDPSRNSVEAVTASLTDVTNEARSVQEEMRSLGL